MNKNAGAVELTFHRWDAAGRTAVSDGLDLGPDWTDDGEERRITVSGALRIDLSSGSINPEPAAQRAEGAADALTAAAT